MGIQHYLSNMRKVTPRRLSSVESGEEITVKFTRVQGRRGQNVTHEGEVASINDSDSLTYHVGDDTFTFELKTGYIRENGDVIGRDGSAKTDAE